MKNSGAEEKRLIPGVRETWKAIKADFDMGAPESEEFDRHCQWLVSKSHCRFADQHSDMTKAVIDEGRALPNADSQIVFLGLLYFAGNSRDYLQPFRMLSKTGMTKGAESRVREVLGDSYPVQFDKFPVSAATGTRCGLEQLKKEHVLMKTVWLTCHYIEVLLGAPREALQNWQRIQELTGCSSLQAVMFMRMFCDINGLDHASAESWTDFSKTYVPSPYLNHGPAVLGQHLRSVSETFPSGRQLIAASVRAEIGLFSARHVEHAGCELRKSLHNIGHIRPIEQVE
jgi:hypothetical protein